MRRTLLTTVAALLAVGTLGSAWAQTLTLSVDCARGQTISHALTQGDARKPLVVVVTGTCNEFVTITRNDVTLMGAPGVGATVNGPGSSESRGVIDVLASRAMIENLIVTGGRFGIRVQSAFGAVVENCVVQNTSGDGIRVVVGEVDISETDVQDTGGNGVAAMRGGTLRVSGGEILRNTVSGIRGDQNATLAVNGVTVANNGSNGIELTNNSYGSITSSTITGNGTNTTRPGHGVYVSGSQAVVSRNPAINNNRDGGVLSTGGSDVNISGTTIIGSHGSGVHSIHGGTLAISGGEISGHEVVGVLCELNCTALLANTTIRDNVGDGINVNGGSKLKFTYATTHSIFNGGYGVFCGDGASSVFDTSLLDGSVSPACTVY